MAELDEQPVARLHRRQQLVEAQVGEEGFERRPRLGMVGDRDAAVQHYGKHLAPTRRRFGRLIGDGRIARQEEGRRAHRLDRHRCDLRLAQKFQRQPVVPRIFARIAGGDPHRRSAGRIGRRRRQGRAADIDQKLPFDELPLLGRDIAQHQPPRFGLHRGVAGCLAVAQRQRHPIGAVGHCHRKQEVIVRAARLHAMAASLIGCLPCGAARRQVEGLRRGDGGSCHQDQGKAGAERHDANILSETNRGARQDALPQENRPCRGGSRNPVAITMGSVS